MKRLYTAVFTILLFYIFLSNPSKIFGQYEVIWRNNIGLFGGANLNIHTPSVSPTFFTPSKITAPFTNSTSSLTGFAGIECDFQIFPIAAITGRIGYDFAGIDLSQKDKNNNNSLDAKLNYLEFSPMVKIFNVIPNLEPLYFTTGVSFGVPIIKKYHFEQKVGNSKPKMQELDIPNVATRVSLPIGIGYIYKYSFEISIVPEISYNINFNDVSSDNSWKNWSFGQFKAGVSVLYRLPRFGKKLPKPTVEATNIDLQMKEIYYLDEYENERHPVNSIQLEEAEFGEFFPIIPYVFYDVNETELDDKYKQNSEETISLAGNVPAEEFLPLDAIEISHKMLDIVGKRLLDNPNSNLIITGTIDGKIENDAKISEYRALGIKQYFINKFNIPESTFQVNFGKQPTKPSAQSVKDGIVENRRVELSSDNSLIFEPIFIKGEKQQIATPDNIYFVPEVTSNKPIIGWELEISQSDRIVRKYTGDTTITPILWAIAMNELYPSQLPIEYKYSIITADTTATMIGHISMDYLTTERKKTIDQSDKVISKYSLVLFDFDSPILTEQNRDIIDKFIIPNIKFGSTIDIYGYSDRIGAAEYNKKLSTLRADAVKNYILTKNRNVRINTLGLGNDSLIFDNETPIGRQLSRTVQIFVVTPKQ